MNEKIKKLQAAIAKDQEKIQQLQAQIEKKNQQIESIRQEEILKQVSTLEKKGVDIENILKAIDAQDSQRLLALLKPQDNDRPSERYF